MKHFAFLILLLAPLASAAQQYRHQLSGTVKEASGTTVPGVTVVLLSLPDSTLESFAMTDSLGRFRLKKAASGKYTLKVSYIGHQSYTRDIELKSSDGDLELGDVQLKPKNVQLKEVSVEADHIPVKIKNDTIEYNARAFKTQPNAVVEDLLKKLPGVEVEKDGTIKAQGKTVNRVLVDGKEFFGDDPAVATKNLPADAVNAVQVFDKKSEMAEFTGIDDGVRDKTINLKLKDEKKQGVFGSVAAGYGTQNRWESKASAHSFKKKMQVSGLAASNNVNQQPFSVMDYVNFMGGFKNLMQGGGGGGKITLSSSDIGLPMGAANNEGFTTTASGGLNFNCDLNSVTELRSSYFYNHLSKEADKTLTRRNQLGRGFYTTHENSFRRGSNYGHRFNVSLKYRTDSSQHLTFRNNTGFTGESLSALVGSRSLTELSSVLGASSSSNTTANNGYKTSSTLSYMKRLDKKGRNFASDFSFGMLNGLSEYRVNALSRFMPGSEEESTDTLNQVQNQGSRQHSYGAKLSYTEPLFSNLYGEISYAYQRTANSLSKDFRDVVSGGASEIPNAALSNRYSNTYYYNRGGAALKYATKAHMLTAGLSWQQSSLKGLVQDENSRIDRSFRNFLPRASWNYTIAPTRSLQMFYQTSVNEPSAEQLQPVVNNTDPLNLYIGNPALNPEYAHNTGMSFNSFDQFSFTSFLGSLNASYTGNKITYYRDTDSNLVQVSRPVNVERDITVSSYFSFSTPLRPLRSKVNLSLNGLYNRGILYVNTLKDNADRWVSTLDLSLENRRKETIDIMAGARLSYNVVKYGLSRSQNQDFVNRTWYADLTFYAPRGWTVGSSLDYTQYAGEVFGEKRDVPVWKAFVSRQFLKNKRGELKLSAVDLLNRNIGISRTSNYAYVQDERTVSLGRYFMLSFTYSLSRFPVKQDNIRIGGARN
jgi:hypothetical protein